MRERHQVSLTIQATIIHSQKRPQQKPFQTCMKDNSHKHQCDVFLWNHMFKANPGRWLFVLSGHEQARASCNARPRFGAHCACHFLLGSSLCGAFRTGGALFGEDLSDSPGFAAKIETGAVTFADRFARTDYSCLGWNIFFPLCLFRWSHSCLPTLHMETSVRHRCTLGSLSLADGNSVSGATGPSPVPGGTNDGRDGGKRASGLLLTQHDKPFSARSLQSKSSACSRMECLRDPVSVSPAAHLTSRHTASSSSAAPASSATEGPPPAPQAQVASPRGRQRCVPASNVMSSLQSKVLVTAPRWHSA